MIHIQEQLKTFSKFLRRDFLAVLVKMLSKELNLKTVRSDWRTRSGMFTFLQNNFEKLINLIQEETIFKWYCLNFEKIEKVFSIRKFMMFLYSNWIIYKNILIKKESIEFLINNQQKIHDLIQNPEIYNKESLLINNQSILNIISSFHSSKKSFEINSPPPSPHQNDNFEEFSIPEIDFNSFSIDNYIDDFMF